MIYELTHSEAFKKSVKVAFKKVDKDDSGTIDKDELTLAMCYFAFNISKKVPGITSPPSRSEVDALFEEFDRDGTGHLTLAEFDAFVTEWVHRNGKNFLWLLAGGLVVHLAVIPFVAHELHREARLFRRIPAVVLGGAITLLVKRITQAVRDT